jgi:hypothetical protein
MLFVGSAWPLYVYNKSINSNLARHTARNVQIGPPAPQAVGCMAMNQNHEGDATIQAIFANLASRLGG